MKQSYTLILDMGDYETKEELMKTLKGISNLLFDEDFGKSVTRGLILKDVMKFEINQSKLIFKKCFCPDIFPFEDDKK